MSDEADRRAVIATAIAALLCSGAARAESQAQASVDTRVTVSETYELANVALATSRFGRETEYLVLTGGEYWLAVVERFLPHDGHRLIASLDAGSPTIIDDYYPFRDNAYAYDLRNGALVRRPGYPRFWQRDAFGARADLVADFARATGFREFFAASQPYYADMIERYLELVQLGRMAAWLEHQFPAHFARYTVVLSPLVWGSHSTRTVDHADGAEALMFVAGPDLPLYGLPTVVVAGLHERIVFTEIDHNYVNPVTDRHATRIGHAMASLQDWNSGAEYRTAYRTFNEYMTWAVFTLYAEETYDPATFAAVNERSEALMERRGFPRYGAFNQRVRELWERRRPGQRVPDLYPAILDWVGAQR